MLDLIRRWRAAAKLRRGQCTFCGEPKADDVPSWDRFCSQACQDEYHARADW